jgi:dihydropyrimidine dehydrogenase (NAD+) subunit PreA
MHYGFRLIDDLTDGLSNWLDEKGVASIDEVIGASVPRISDFGDFDLSYKVVAEIDHDLCINCNLCYVACDEGAHQTIDLRVDGMVIDPATYTGQVKAEPYVRQDDCVGCNLCSLVCPVEDCITMVEKPSGRESVTWKELTTERPEVLNWDEMQKYREEVGIDIH